MSDPTLDRPTSAGIYDFFLGGDAHRSVDAEAGKRIVGMVPEVVDGAMANRGFLQRAVRKLVTDFGIRQFIDLGSGLPTQRNTHDVVGELLGGQGRVMYVDIDSLAVARSQQLLSGLDWAHAIQGDLRDPETVLAHPELRRLIDFNEPVAVLMVAVLHFISDDDDPWRLVTRYTDPLTSGSYLVISHSSGSALVPDQARAASLSIYARIGTPATDRSRTEIERFFEGLQLVSPYPGAQPELAHVGVWGAEDPAEADSDGSRFAYAGVARKP